MDIRFDAGHFEKLGRLVQTEGWTGFLKHGPTLEPLYPSIIAQSMRLENVLNIPYQKIQAAIQILFLFISQMLLYQFLKLLKIHTAIILTVLLYFGFSPGLVNGTFSLFSEIITFPFLLGCVWFSVRIWQSILNRDIQKTFYNTCYFTILATTVTFSKAILEYVFLAFLLPFIVVLVKALIVKEHKRSVAAFLFLSLFVCVSHGSLAVYKSLNQKYNGHYTFTDFRGPYMFYQYAVKRTRPLTGENLMVPLLSIPGEQVCRAKYGEACQDWWYDNYSYSMAKEKELLAEGIPQSAVYGQLFKLGFIQIAHHPFSYGLLTSFEAIKLFFWESTKVGFVYYPSWIEAIHENTLFKNGLRLTIFILTVIGFIGVIRHLWKQSKNGGKIGEDTLLLGFSLYFVFLFMTLYASVITITRYAFPIASFYLIFIAFFLNQLFFKKN